MRQVTGSNLTINNKKVSIQVTLGGLSFSAHKATVADDAESIEIIVDTPRVTLVPREEVTTENAAEYLRIAETPCRSNEQCVCSSLNSEIVAVIAIDSEALTSIVEKWGSRASFTSPLSDMRHSDKNCITLDLSKNVCYIRHFDDGLQFAEALPYRTADDVLYFVNGASNGHNDIPIYIKGDNDTAKLLRRYYKVVICE